MTTAEAILRCKIIIDKYGSPTILDSEWMGHLNAAQYEVLNRMIPDTVGGVVNYELNVDTITNVSPLIYTVNANPSSGLISFSNLTTSLRTASSDNSCTVFRVLNMATTDDTMIKFVKHNNLYSYKANVFKAPTNSNPLFTIIAQGYQVYPSTGVTVKLTLMKTPKTLTNTGESLEFSDYVAQQVILQAVKLAGVGIRDQEVIMDVRNTGFQSAQ